MKKILLLASVFLLGGCSNYKQNEFQGYVEGYYTYLSSAISGNLEKLAIDKGDQVKAGDLIYILDQQPEIDQLQQAQSNLIQAKEILSDLQKGSRQTVLAALKAQRQQIETSLELSKKTYYRYKQLRKTDSIDQESLDKAKTQYQNDIRRLQEINANIAEAELGARENQIAAQQAEVQAAQTAVKQAKWALEQKIMHAPKTGKIFDTFFRKGEFVPAGSPIASMLAAENIKIIFFIPETMLFKTTIGQKIEFICDGCKEKYPATIYYISSQAEYTPPIIYSRKTREKLVYRIEAKIAPQIAAKLHAGQPVDVYLQ